MRSFLTPIRKTARYILWRAETTGSGEVANSILPKNADSQATLQNENLQWLWKRAREGEFIRWSYPVADATRAAASGPLLVPPRRGTLSDRRVTAGDVLEPAEGKNPYAQALSALGASKGGAARAGKLSKKRRAEIARKAAKARWKPRS